LIKEIEIEKKAAENATPRKPARQTGAYAILRENLVLGVYPKSGEKKNPLKGKGAP